MRKSNLQSSKTSHRKAGDVAASLTTKKLRAISGLHSIRCALDACRTDHIELWVADRQGSEVLKSLLQLAERKQVPVKTVVDSELKRVHAFHQGAILWSEKLPELSLHQMIFGDQATVILVDQIEDPQNFGALTRTAWLLGVDAIVFPDQKNVDLTPAVHKVASGGIEFVNLVQVNNLKVAAQNLKDAGFWIYGLSHSAELSLSQTQFSGKVGLFLGSEERGLRSGSRGLCDHFVRIQQADPDASLNASVALSLVLYESLRQRGKSL